MSSEINTDELASAFDNFQIEHHHSFEPVLVKKNLDILSQMFEELNDEISLEWKITDFSDKVFQLTELEPSSSEYDKIKTLFANSMRRGYTVDKIQRIENPYLLIQYNLKKLKKENCSEKKLFHGTSEDSVRLICTDNFNWRLAGTSVGHRFGRGVSFSPDSTYSSYYPSVCISDKRTMIVANVLIKSYCLGDSSMTIPDEPADTSIKPDRKVLVKYEDNDFYPMYVIYYS